MKKLWQKVVKWFGGAVSTVSGYVSPTKKAGTLWKIIGAIILIMSILYAFAVVGRDRDQAKAMLAAIQNPNKASSHKQNAEVSTNRARVVILPGPGQSINAAATMEMINRLRRQLQEAHGHINGMNAVGPKAPPAIQPGPAIVIDLESQVVKSSDEKGVVSAVPIMDVQTKSGKSTFWSALMTHGIVGAACFVGGLLL